MDPTSAFNDAVDFVDSTPTDTTSSMPSWMGGIFGGITGLAGVAGQTLTGIYSANAATQQAAIQASTIAAQQQAMAQLAGTSQVIGAQQTKQYMIYGVGILLFMLVLRQTRQS